MWNLNQHCKDGVMLMRIQIKNNCISASHATYDIYLHSFELDGEGERLVVQVRLILRVEGLVSFTHNAEVCTTLSSC
jgi:hypothetical protein